MNRATKKQSEFKHSRLLLGKNLPAFEDYPFQNHPERGYIVWPPQVTGSISHKKNRLALIVSERPEKLYGVDLEEIKVSKKVYERVTSEEERSLLEKAWPKDQKLSLLYSLTFSMKESLFKVFSQDQEESYPKVLGDCSLKGFHFESKSFRGVFKKRNLEAKGEFFFVHQKEKEENKRMVLTLCSRSV